MKKIETIEELLVEKKQLNVVAKEMEEGLQNDFRYFSGRIQPLLSIFESSGSSHKVPSLLWKGAATIVPLLLAGRKAKAGLFATSPWMALGTAAIGLLASGQRHGLLEKIGGFFSSFGKKKKNRKHRHHRLCRYKN